MKITRISNKSITMPPPPTSNEPPTPLKTSMPPPKTKPSDVKPIIEQLDNSVLPGVKNTFKGPGKQSISDFMAELSDVIDDPASVSKVKSKLKSLDHKLDSKFDTRANREMKITRVADYRMTDHLLMRLKMIEKVMSLLGDNDQNIQFIRGVIRGLGEKDPVRAVEFLEKLLDLGLSDNLQAKVDSEFDKIRIELSSIKEQLNKGEI